MRMHEPSRDNFTRTITFSAAASLVIGSIIGSGIFMRPAEMAQLLQSPALIFAAWIIAGIFTLFSVMVYAEFGAMVPATGGQYVFMKLMYGNFWAFLFGWAEFIVINTAGTAGIAFICAEYANYLFQLPRFDVATEQSFSLYVPLMGTILPLENAGVKVLTMLVLLILTYTSYRSTRLGTGLQLVFTVAKVLAILILTAGLFFSDKGSMSNFIQDNTSLIPAAFTLVAAMVAAINGGLQSFDGWANMLHVAGEVKNPSRNIPRSLLVGVFACMFIYLLVTASMIYMLPVTQMAKESLVASAAAEVAFGTVGGVVIAILICVSVIGTTNATVMTAPRMSYAMARSGYFFRFAGNVHPRFNTPSNALWLHFAVMLFMVMSGSFYILADMYIFILWIFNLMMIIGLFILRKKLRDMERPYKVWGYPWMPILLIAFNAFYLVITLYNDINNYLIGKTHIINAGFGTLLVATGVPFYFYFKSREKNLKI